MPGALANKRFRKKMHLCIDNEMNSDFLSFLEYGISLEMK